MIGLSAIDHWRKLILDWTPAKQTLGWCMLKSPSASAMQQNA